VSAHPFDDLANGAFVPELVEWAREHGPTMPLAEVRRIRCARAAPVDADERGDYMAESLVDLVERMGLGRLVREGDGEVVIRLAEPMPSARALEERWHRAYMDNAAREARRAEA
jgi:hypothetical protein